MRLYWKNNYFSLFLQVHYFRKHNLDNEHQVKEKFRIPDGLHSVHGSAGFEECLAREDIVSQREDGPDDAELHAAQEDDDADATYMDVDNDDEDGPLSQEDKDQLRLVDTTRRKTIKTIYNPK
jgi:hypothetical protein